MKYPSSASELNTQDGEDEIKNLFICYKVLLKLFFFEIIFINPTKIQVN